MALTTKSLVRIRQVTVGSAAGVAQGKQISKFLYATDDAAATVEAGGYFNGARAQLSVGDVIEASMANGGTPVTKTYVATAVPAAGNVVVALQATSAG